MHQFIAPGTIMVSVRRRSQGHLQLLKLGMLAAILLLSAALRSAHAAEEYTLTPGDVMKVRQTADVKSGHE